MTQTFKVESADQVAPQIYKTAIGGLFYLDYSVHGDDRGFFAEAAILDDLNQTIGSTFTPRQFNVARSQINVSRGFHAEPWNKLITVIGGAAFCAIADIRPDSPTYKQTVSFQLGFEENCLKGCVYIPEGLANSYCAISGPTNYVYLVDKLYRDRGASADISISLFDPDLNVTWPVKREDMILSARDQSAVTLSSINS